MDMEQDVFCRIVEGVISTNRLHDDERVLAFTDINPQAPVHIIVIPKKHFSSLNDLTEKDEDLVGHMLLVAQKLAREQGVATAGYRLVLNCGPHGGQVVPHLHLHLLGGRELAGDM
jgi:histidine triad (HIT) family protein